MAISTYSELQSAVADWLNRSDLTSVLPNFIALAEARFNREIRARRMLTTEEITIPTAGYDLDDLTGDYLEAKTLYINQGHCEFVTQERALDYAYLYNNAVNKPWFTIKGELLVLAPSSFPVYQAPALSETDPLLLLDDYPIALLDSTPGIVGSLTYYTKIPALSISNTSNWLLSDHPDLYLYGTLVQTAPYLREDERVSVWNTIYDRLMNDFRIADERAQASGSTLVMRPVRPF